MNYIRVHVLVRSTPERAVRVRTLAGDIVLCSWARYFTLTVPLSTQVHKWVHANCWGNLTNCREVTCDGLASYRTLVGRVIETLVKVWEIWKKHCFCSLWLAFPQHFSLSQTSTCVSIKQLDYELEISFNFFYYKSTSRSKLYLNPLQRHLENAKKYNYFISKRTLLRYSLSITE